jgi:hypothetical protein
MVTLCPASSSFSVKPLPKKPVPPVINTFKLDSFAYSILLCTEVSLQKITLFLVAGAFKKYKIRFINAATVFFSLIYLS